jgi:hypothetical protein
LLATQYQAGPFGDARIQGRKCMAARGPFRIADARRGQNKARQCWNWGYLKPDGTRYRVCRYHGALGAEYGHIAWRKVVRGDKDITVSARVDRENEHMCELRPRKS